MTCVLAFGTFDIVHEGHAYYLSEAKKQGDKLIVIIARDKNVFIERKTLPRNNEETRRLNIETLKIADKVVLGFVVDKLKVIQEYKPDIICLGYDQNSINVEEYIKRNNLLIKTVRIAPYKPELYKSSKMKLSNKMEKTNE